MEKPSGREFRVAVDAWPAADLEIRAEPEGRTFTGYAAVFNSWSEDLGGFRERIEPGAFTRTLESNGNIRMFLNHNTDVLLATTRGQTLRLSQDDKGLRVEADLPDTTAGRDLAELLARHDVDSMSFGFNIPRSGDIWSDDLSERTLREVKLHEVSPVTGWPAYPATSAFVRHLADIAGSDPESIEAAMRALIEPGAQLTDEQRDLLVRTINSRSGVRVMSEQTATWRERVARYKV